MRARLAPALAWFCASGCAMSHQSVIDPAGHQASGIANLWWFFLALLGAIFVVVIVLTMASLLRANRPRSTEQTERKLTHVVGAAAVATVLILVALITVSVVTGRATAGNTHPGKHLVVEVTGNQWWWAIRYPNDDPTRIIVSANEIHVPVGVPVLIRGTSLDVIHSFWIPNLQGKRDLIPSRITTEWFEADKPGRYRGQCAEFCGLQHAHMALWVVAETPGEFESWAAGELQPAPEPSDPWAQRGREVFLRHACVFCHAIEGTPAAGQVGPDLTHVASRLTIAAGSLPNNKGNLAAWIADPQNIKPGNHMATVPLETEDLQALLDYMETLK